jgi:hypothetical protein
MSKFFLIASPEGGEQQLVISLEGYKDWAVVAEGLREPEPGETYDQVKKKWVKDEAKEARRAKIASLRDPERLLDELEAMKVKITRLENQLEQVKKGPLNG